MKRVAIALMLVVLVLAACAPQTTSPEDKAKFCADLQVFMEDLQNLISLGADAPTEDLKAAYSTAATSFHTLQEDGKNMSEPEVKEFFDAASGLNTALDYFVTNPNPDPANKAQAMASLQQQAELFKDAYENLTETVCPAQ
jgi:hypothetical protein